VFGSARPIPPYVRIAVEYVFTRTDAEPNMSTPAVRVSDDPALVAAVRAEADRRADEAYPAALAAVRTCEWVYSEQRDALRHRRGRAVADLQALLTDRTASPAGRLTAATTLADLGFPDGEAAVLGFLADPDAGLRAAALVKLRRFEGRHVDLSPSDRAARVLAMIDDPDSTVALAAATVAVDRRMSGAADRVAARLAAGTVTDRREWAAKLAEVVDTPRQAELAAAELFRDPPRTFGTWSYGYALRPTLRHPDPAVREPVRAALCAYCLRFPAERYSQHLVRDLAEAAGPDQIPVLENVALNATDPASRLYAVDALARLDPARAVDRVLTHARRDRLYADLLETLFRHATETDADRVIPSVRPKETLFTDPLGSDYLNRAVKLLLGRFGDRGRAEVGQWVGRLTGQARARAEWGLRGLTLRAALEEFVAARVLPGPADRLFDEVRRSCEENASGGGFDPADPVGVLTAFFQAGLAVTFDAETGMVPCDHDRLVMLFADGTGGLLAPECAIQTWQGGEDDMEVPMSVRFVSRGRVYEFDAENLGDWYDVGAVAQAVNRALGDAGHRQRFIHLHPEGQCPVFALADPAAFLPVAARYFVPVDDDTTAAMTAGVAYERYVIDLTDISGAADPSKSVFGGRDGPGRNTLAHKSHNSQ
jgi:hypothetical protein